MFLENVDNCSVHQTKSNHPTTLFQWKCRRIHFPLPFVFAVRHPSVLYTLSLAQSRHQVWTSRQSVCQSCHDLRTTAKSVFSVIRYSQPGGSHATLDTTVRQETAMWSQKYAVTWLTSYTHTHTHTNRPLTLSRNCPRLCVKGRLSVHTPWSHKGDTRNSSTLSWPQLYSRKRNPIPNEEKAV